MTITTSDDYKFKIMMSSKNFSETFLNMKSLLRDVKEDIFKLPIIAYQIAFGALVVGLISLFMPIAYTVWFDRAKEVAKIESMQRQIDELRSTKGLKLERD